MMHGAASTFLPGWPNLNPYDVLQPGALPPGVLPNTSNSASLPSPAAHQALLPAHWGSGLGIQPSLESVFQGIQHHHQQQQQVGHKAHLPDLQHSLPLYPAGLPPYHGVPNTSYSAPSVIGSIPQDLYSHLNLSQLETINNELKLRKQHEELLLKLKAAKQPSPREQFPFLGQQNSLEFHNREKALPDFSNVPRPAHSTALPNGLLNGLHPHGRSDKLPGKVHASHHSRSSDYVLDNKPQVYAHNPSQTSRVNEKSTPLNYLDSFPNGTHPAFAVPRSTTKETHQPKLFDAYAKQHLQDRKLPQSSSAFSPIGPIGLPSPSIRPTDTSRPPSNASIGSSHSNTTSENSMPVKKQKLNDSSVISIYSHQARDMSDLVTFRDPYSVPNTKASKIAADIITEAKHSMLSPPARGTERNIPSPFYNKSNAPYQHDVFNRPHSRHSDKSPVDFRTENTLSTHNPSITESPTDFWSQFGLTPPADSLPNLTEKHIKHNGDILSHSDGLLQMNKSKKSNEEKPIVSAAVVDMATSSHPEMPLKDMIEKTRADKSRRRSPAPPVDPHINDLVDAKVQEILAVCRQQEQEKKCHTSNKPVSNIKHPNTAADIHYKPVMSSNQTYPDFNKQAKPQLGLSAVQIDKQKPSPTPDARHNNQMVKPDNMNKNVWQMHDGKPPPPYDLYQQVTQVRHHKKDRLLKEHFQDNQAQQANHPSLAMTTKPHPLNPNVYEFSDTNSLSLNEQINVVRKERKETHVADKHLEHIQTKEKMPCTCNPNDPFGKNNCASCRTNKVMISQSLHGNDETIVKDDPYSLEKYLQGSFKLKIEQRQQETILTNTKENVQGNSQPEFQHTGVKHDPYKFNHEDSYGSLQAKNDVRHNSQLKVKDSSQSANKINSSSMLQQNAPQGFSATKKPGNKINDSFRKKQIKSSLNYLKKSHKIHNGKYPALKKTHLNGKIKQGQSDDFAEKLLKNLGFPPLTKEDLITKRNLKLPPKGMIRHSTIASDVLNSEKPEIRNEVPLANATSPNLPGLDSNLQESFKKSTHPGEIKPDIGQQKTNFPFSMSKSAEEPCRYVSRSGDDGQPLKRSRSFDDIQSLQNTLKSETNDQTEAITDHEKTVLSNQIGDLRNMLTGQKDNLATNAVAEPPKCGCLGPDSIFNEAVEGPYYTHLGYGRSVEAIRKTLETRTDTYGTAIRIEKVRYTGREGKSQQGCPLAKWIVRRSGIDEKYLAIVRHRPGHFCESSWLIIGLVAWEGIPAPQADSLYDYLSGTLPDQGNETERRCGTNDRKMCACQGADLATRGASFSFGCSWSMYFNGCKFARSQVARKFKLKDASREESLEKRLQDLSTFVGPLYKQCAPQAHANQVAYSEQAQDCRLGNEPGGPFSGVTSCVDFCAHAHKDIHNMNNGSTVVVTLTKHRGLSKPEDEQLHVLPLYVLEPTDEANSFDGQRIKIEKGALEVLHDFPLEARIRSHPLTPQKKKREMARLDKKNPGRKRRLNKYAGGALASSSSAQSTPNKKEVRDTSYLQSQDSSHSMLSYVGSVNGTPVKSEVHNGRGSAVTGDKPISHQELQLMAAQTHNPAGMYDMFWDYFYHNGAFPPSSLFDGHRKHSAIQSRDLQSHEKYKTQENALAYTKGSQYSIGQQKIVPGSSTHPQHHREIQGLNLHAQAHSELQGNKQGLTSNSQHQSNLQGQTTNAQNHISMPSPSSNYQHKGNMQGQTSNSQHQGSMQGPTTNSQHQGSMQGPTTNSQHQGSMQGPTTNSQHQGSMQGPTTNSQHQGSMQGTTNSQHQGSMQGTTTNSQHQGSMQGPTTNSQHQGSMQGPTTNSQHQGSMQGPTTNSQHQGSMQGPTTNSQHQGSMQGTTTNSQHQGSMQGTTTNSQHQGSMQGLTSQHQGSMQGPTTNSQHQGNMLGLTSQHQGSMQGPTTNSQHQGSMQGPTTNSQHQGSMQGLTTNSQHQGNMLGLTSQHQGNMRGKTSTSQHNGNMHGLKLNSQHQQDLLNRPQSVPLMDQNLAASMKPPEQHLPQHGHSVHVQDPFNDLTFNRNTPSTGKLDHSKLNQQQGINSLPEFKHFDPLNFKETIKNSSQISSSCDRSVSDKQNIDSVQNTSKTEKHTWQAMSSMPQDLSRSGTGNEQVNLGSKSSPLEIPSQTVHKTYDHISNSQSINQVNGLFPEDLSVIKGKQYNNQYGIPTDLVNHGHMPEKYSESHPQNNMNKFHNSPAVHHQNGINKPISETIEKLKGHLHVNGAQLESSSKYNVNGLLEKSLFDQNPSNLSGYQVKHNTELPKNNGHGFNHSDHVSQENFNISEQQKQMSNQPKWYEKQNNPAPRPIHESQNPWNMFRTGLQQASTDTKPMEPSKPDPDVVKCEMEYNQDAFRDPNIGGVAIALCHGAVLFEVAKRELHATTGLRKPNRYHPTRISLVFYQHKSLNNERHGMYAYAKKLEDMKQKRIEKMQQEQGYVDMALIENSFKGGKKRKLDDVKVEQEEVVDIMTTSAAQYRYLWECSTNREDALITDTMSTYKWVNPQPMVTGPYQKWV